MFFFGRHARVQALRRRAVLALGGGEGGGRWRIVCVESRAEVCRGWKRRVVECSGRDIRKWEIGKKVRGGKGGGERRRQERRGRKEGGGERRKRGGGRGGGGRSCSWASSPSFDEGFQKSSLRFSPSLPRAPSLVHAQG